MLERILQNHFASNLGFLFLLPKKFAYKLNPESGKNFAGGGQSAGVMTSVSKFFRLYGIRSSAKLLRGD